MAAERGEAWYTPGRIDFLLRHWEELAAAAESPGTAAHRFDPQFQKEGPSPATPRTGVRQAGYRSGGNPWACAIADLTRAYRSLPTGLGKRAVAARRYHTLTAIAYHERVRKDDLLHAYEAASRAMAETLGWEPPPEEGNEGTGNREPPFPVPSFPVPSP